jgi:hypothetical protein
LDNKILGVSINATITQLKCVLGMESMATFVSLAEGISTCMERPDNPDPPVVEVCWPMLLLYLLFIIHDF